MKKLITFLTALHLVLPAHATIYWTSAPSSAQSGQSYSISAYASGPGSNYLDIYKNGSWFASGWGMYSVSAGNSTTDYGAQTVNYYAIATYYFGNEYEPLDYSEDIYHSVSIWTPNYAPYGAFDYAAGTVTKGQNLQAWGWAADEEMGAPFSRVDIIIDGSDVGDATLGGYRPDVASAYSRGDFTYSGWNVSYNTGGLSPGNHTIEMVAWDNQGASTYLGSRSFTVTNHAPAITLNSPPSQTITVNTALTITSTATDADGNITHHNLDIQRPDGSWNWQGGFAYGEPYMGGPVGSAANSTRSASFTFNQTGVWNVRAWVNDANGNSLHSATVQITVNQATQYISFGNPGPKQRDLNSITLSASASSGLPVSFSVVSGPATVSGNTLTFTGTGNVTVRASQAGNATYAPAAPVDNTFLISANPTITQALLDGSGNDLGSYAVANGSGSGNTSVSLAFGQSWKFRVSGTDSDPNLTTLYLRVRRPSNVAGANPSAADFFLSTNVWYRDQGITQGASGSYTTATMLADEVGTWSVWSHVSDAIALGWGGANPWTGNQWGWQSSGGYPQLIVNKATPTGTFGSRTFNAAGSGYTVAAGDLNATFANPYSGSVAAPGGTVTYSIVGPGTAVTAGTVLTAGQTYTIRASYPGDGNYNATSVDATWTVADTGAPSVPTGLSASALTATSFTLNWSASSDNVGVTAYEVFRNGTSLGTTGSTSMGVTGLSPSTTYTMTVRARDAAGNWSAQSAALNVTTPNPPDTTPPTVPTGLSSSNIQTTSFTLNWSPSSDNVGVTAYEVFRNGTSLGTTASTSFALSGLTPSTTYSMTVRARDAAGNWSAQSTALNVTTQMDPAADNDGDGISNGVEQALGTDPNSANSADSGNSNALKIHRPNSN